MTDEHIHANGNMAYEVGQETGEQKFKDGSSSKVDYFVTNVYEKLDGVSFPKIISGRSDDAIQIESA